MRATKYDKTISHACPRENKKRKEPNTNLRIEHIAQLIKEKVIGRSTSPRDKAMFAFLSAAGCRVSELTSIKKKDLSIQEKEGEPFLFVAIKTLKNPDQKNRDVVLLINDYKPLLDLFFEYEKPIEDPDQLLFGIKRNWVFMLCKIYFGSDYFPHWFRHYVASFDARNGCPIPIMQTKMGWSDPGSAKPYLHLDSSSLVNFQLQLRRKNYTVKAVDSDEVVLNKQSDERIRIVKHKNLDSSVEKIKKTLPVKPKTVEKKVTF